MKVLQLNASLNSGSTGRIASEIGDLLISEGHKSTIAYGRTARPGSSEAIRIGNRKDLFLHLAASRLFDNHGFSSKGATTKFINHIDDINPDIIHLHNIHGYYVHVGILFDYLNESGKPVVWTIHDCWPFTGHCSFFDRVNCTRWQTECYKCPLIHGYPESWFLDNSRFNYRRKKILFSKLRNITLVSPSNWLAGHLKNSFLKSYPLKVINNGVDLDIFKPADSSVIRSKYKLNDKRIILGVASIWDRRKGLTDFIKLRSMLDSTIEIVLIGLNPEQIKNLPNGITGLVRTESLQELAAFYSIADVFVNPTYVDNFPTVNLEALACGVPVVTYNTGGSPEAIDPSTGRVVQKGDLENLKNEILNLLKNGKNLVSDLCRLRAAELYNKTERYMDYISLYKEILNR